MRSAIEFVRNYWEQLPLAVPAILDLRCQVLLIEGRARSGENVAVVYAGRCRNHAYLLKSIFEDSEVRDRRRTSVFRYKAATRRWIESADLLLIDIGWPYNDRINRAGAFVEVPDWIDMSIDIEGGLGLPGSPVST